MSCHKRSFHCFNAVGGETSHKSSHPLEHATTWLPRIPQHGMTAYRELEQEGCLCSACRYGQTLEDVENQLLPFYHTHPPYHHHHPQQYVLSGPSRHEETHAASECHIHHQRHDKKIVLVKNSDPSFRKTIILHHRGLRNFGLFLEEVSELMQYHIRKLYTQEGCKIDSIQSLLQCSGVLVCVGRESSHPSILQNFEKTSSHKLPKLSGKSRAREHTDSNERLTLKTSTILPNLEDDNNKATKQSVSSDKSVPDGRDSPGVVNSCPPSGESVTEDDIEKRVRVNKDGSLSMEMKVRFRLPNDETLHWSTKVKKTAGRTYGHVKGHSKANLAQISDVNCSGSEIMSADEAYFTQHYQGRKDKAHCPYCCSHCQGYETWKNVPGTHGARQCTHTSSSSTSSHTVVSRKTVIERQTISRSSEELGDQVVETCITESIGAAETVEFCTIQRETCLPKCNVKPSTLENADSTGLYNCPKSLDLKTPQESDKKEEEFAACASQTSTGDDETEVGNDGSFSPICSPARQETTGSEVLDTGSLIPRHSEVSEDEASKTPQQSTKPELSKPFHICHCGKPESVQIEPKEKMKPKAGAEGQMQRDESCAMSGNSDVNCSSKVECIEERKRSKSATSVNSTASTNCNSAVSGIATDGLQADDDKIAKDRTSSCLSMKSFESSEPAMAPPVKHESDEDEKKQDDDDSELRTQSSLSALSSVSAELKLIAQEASEEEDNQVTAEENKDSEPRVTSAISRKSTGSRKSRLSEDKSVENQVETQGEEGIRPSLTSATSGKTTVSPTSGTSVRATTSLSIKSNKSTKSRESKTPEVNDVKKADIIEHDNTEGESELRSQSKLSVKSERSVKSNTSAKTSKSKTSEVAHDESFEDMKDDHVNVTERPDTSEAKASSVVSNTSVGSKSVTPTEQNACEDDGETVERAGSGMSVTSAKSHTSAVSLKSETSQVSTTHSGNLCDESNDLHATSGRSSCRSDKSIKSNISERSSNLKGGDKLKQCQANAANEEERGSSAMSEKSAKSNVTIKSTCSKASGKSNLSKPSDFTADGNSVDHTEQTERAPSNMSTASANSSKSHASAACVKEEAAEICCNPSEEIFSEEQIQGRSVSSKSVQSVKSNSSSRSGRTNCSNCNTAADATEMPLQDSEEMRAENRAASCTSAKSDGSQRVRSGSAMSVISTKSKNSTKSTKSNTSHIASSIRPCEDTSEEAIQERVPSVLSVKSTKSATSVESTKSKCSTFSLQEKNSETVGQENDEELLQERPVSRGSSVSERSVKSTERPHSVLSEVSEMTDKGDCEDETEQRGQSAKSTKTERSTASAKSESTEHDNLHENIAHHEDMLERASSNMSARSEKSTKSNISTVSKKSNVDASYSDVVHPEEKAVEGEREQRSVSSKSVDSIVSAKSNRSVRSFNADVEDGVEHENDDERPLSSMSAKSVQSRVSEISMKSTERTPSSLSAKSVKSSTTGICLEKCPDESNALEETQTRAESVLSTKTERSASSAKSNRSKGLDSRADENIVDDDENVERSPSNLSVTSKKSTKSNTSKGSKRSKVSKICSENETANADSEDKPSSSLSVRSNLSVKSNKSKCSIEARVAKRTDNDNLDDENEKETNIERAPSSLSTTSVQSSVSKASLKTDKRAASALSDKSHASVTSDLTNVSELPSGRTSLPDEVDSEDEKRTQSVKSVKSTNSASSDKSTMSARLDHEKHCERSSSNLSLKSGRSSNSTVSKRSEVYEVYSENGADNCDVRIVEGESEGSTISERFDNENENPKRPPSSSSAKSVISHISEKSAKSADRPPSASSAKSAKSVQSNISDSKSSKTVESYDKGTASQQRTSSAMSSKTARSTSSTKSSKVKEDESPTEEDGGHEDRNPSSMSARSVKLSESISKVPQELKATAVSCEPNAKSGNEAGSQEEDNESRSVSSMSIHSVKSDISAKSDMSKYSSDIQVQDMVKRSDSPASVVSIRSNSSGVFSDINPTEEKTDKKASQDRSESAASAKSASSEKSNKSLAAPTEECRCDLNLLQRTASNLSIKSAKSDISNSSVTSTKSKTVNITSEHEQETTGSDIEEEGNLASSQMTKSNVSGCSKKSSSDVASVQSAENPNGDYSEETMQDRAESHTSGKTGCSCVSERAIGSKVSSQAIEEVDEHERRNERTSSPLSADLAKSMSIESAKSSDVKVDDVSTENYVTESNSNVERATSTVSERSAKSKTSERSKRSKGGVIDNSKEESLERASSCMSGSSVTETVEQDDSAMPSKTNESRTPSTVSQVSDTTFNEENTNESNIPTNLEMSSRVATPCDVTSVDSTTNGGEKAPRPPSTLSTKSAKSTKSSTSKKSCKLQISQKPDSSIKSTIARDSDGGSNQSETLDNSSENVCKVDERTEEIGIKPLSPVSGKSVKTNASSVSTKSKASHSQIANKEDQSNRTQSVLSIKSDCSSKTKQSNRSCITPTEGIENIEEITDLMSEAKPNKCIDPDIPLDESNAHNDEDAFEKSAGTQSPVSTKSPKSKKSCVPAEESSTCVVERAISPVSAKSTLSEALGRSEVPFVTIEESESKSPTVMSSKSKASGRSKKSRTSEIQGEKSARKSQSSLSVHSNVSVKSKKSNITDVSTATVVSDNTREGGTSSDTKESPNDRTHSKTNKSKGERKDASAYINKQSLICHADSTETDLSQTLSCSDKEICETSPTRESKSPSNRIVNGVREATDSVSDKSDKGSKQEKNNKDAGDFGLVPSILPNTSPTEVVNEWLKTLPTERDLYEMEELNGTCDGVKDKTAAEEASETEEAEKNESEAAHSNEVNGMDDVQNHDCQTITEAPNEDNTCTQREDGSKMFNSSIQLMKVLLNPKLDRCNSLPEISPVYGRKLSTSAQGLLDCLIKLQLIDRDPEKANEKNERYQELMSILQSLWLSTPSEKDHVQNTNDHHSVEGEYNHTSSSGVDVNSGSTGSGKSSDGIKSSNNVNIDGSLPENSFIMAEKAYNETDTQWKPELEEENQEDDPGTDETIRSNDSPREPPETPSSSNQSSGDSSGNDKKLSKKLSQDSDPVWVLTLLNKIEKQFMTHYISAMKELKVRWSLGDTNQLDMMIDELKAEVHKKIQISIEREVKKIQERGRLPRPPNEPKPSKQTEERRQRMKHKLQESMDSQAEKSDSTTGTSYSDQRGENIDDYCPCETCVEKKLNSMPPLSEEVRRSAPVVMDYDLKRILLMKTGVDCAVPSRNENDTTAETLVEKVIIGAIKEVESNKEQNIRHEGFTFPADEKEEDNATIEETHQVLAVENQEEINIAEAERPGSETGTTYTGGEKTSEAETASEEGTVDATLGGENGSHVNIDMSKKKTDMLQGGSEDEEETTKTISSKYKHITAATMESPDCANEIHHDTVASASTDVQSKDESEQEEKHALVEELSSTEQESGQQSMMNAENKDRVTVKEMVMDQTKEEESEAEGVVVKENLTENESSSEVGCSEDEDKEPTVEVSVAQKTNVKSSEEDEDPEVDEDSFSDTKSNATLSEMEKETIETSSIARSEQGSEKIVKQTMLTDQKSDMEEGKESTDTGSDYDSVEESAGTRDEDETEDGKEGTINELSSLQEEEASDDELSATSEAELKKMQTTAEDGKNNEAESEVQTSGREGVEEDSLDDQENTISPVNSNDSPDENEAARTESSGEQDEGAMTEDGLDIKEEGVTGEHEAAMAASPDQEKTKEAGEVNPQGDVDDSKVLKSSSSESEDESEESETATSAHNSEKDATEEERTDEGELPAVSANETQDKNRDLSTVDESSEEDDIEATTVDETFTDEENSLTQKGDSKDEMAKDEMVTHGSDGEVSEEAGTVDHEEAETASESESSAGDINSTSNDDESAEDNGVMSSELSIECAENDTKHEQDGEKAAVTSAHEFEEAENEEVVNCEEQTVKVKHRHDLGVTSEAEDDHSEDQIDADTTENKSGKDAVEEATSRDGSDSEDETNEEKEDRLKEEQSIESTDAEEEASVKTKSDSAKGSDAFSKNETSATETEQEINKAHEDSVETTDGEESDVPPETDPGSTIEGSSKAVSEYEEGNSSAIDDEKSTTNLGAGPGETTGQEDTSTAKDDEFGDEDSIGKSEDRTVDGTSQEYTDENESSSQGESLEQFVLAQEVKSSVKVEETEDVQEENKSKEVKTSCVDELAEDETPLEESESVEKESESESKCEDSSEVVTEEHKDYKITYEDLSETEIFDSKKTKSDNGKKSRSKDACEEGVEVKSGNEAYAEKTNDGSVEEKEQEFTESQNAALSALNDNVKDSEKEDEDTDTPNERWRGSLGDSADGEDEAEEDSEPEEDTNDGEKPFVADKLGSLDATKEAPKKVLLIPLDPLIKKRAESEDGAYADVEDSETEIHGQDDVTSLESRSLKKI